MALDSVAETFAPYEKDRLTVFRDARKRRRRAPAPRKPSPNRSRRQSFWTPSTGWFDRYVFEAAFQVRVTLAANM